MTKMTEQKHELKEAEFKNVMQFLRNYKFANAKVFAAKYVVSNWLLDIVDCWLLPNFAKSGGSSADHRFAREQKL